MEIIVMFNENERYSRRMSFEVVMCGFCMLFSILWMKILWNMTKISSESFQQANCEGRQNKIYTKTFKIFSEQNFTRHNKVLKKKNFKLFMKSSLTWKVPAHDLAEIYKKKFHFLLGAQLKNFYSILFFTLIFLGKIFFVDRKSEIHFVQLFFKRL